ncbi:unnamed protein product [Schistosoma intercalatum]|nr:unnamed protein product [Schistosoma intercalatum]
MSTDIRTVSNTRYSTLRISSLTEFLSVSYQNGHWKYLRYRGNIYNSITQHLQIYATIIGGRSKATLVRLKGQNYQSAIFFFLLAPRENGPSFAGVDRILADDVLPAYDGVIIDLHRQGPHSHFRLFYGGCSDTNNCFSNELVFRTSGEREQVKIPFRNFSSYPHVASQCNSKFSGLTQKSHIGIKVYGGSNEPENQCGPGSIEIFTISAYKESQMLS